MKRRTIIVAVSISGTVLLGAAMLLFFHATARLSRTEARDRVFLYLHTELSRQQVDRLKEQGRKVPDLETARHWQASSNRINRLTVSSLTIRQPLPDILLNPDQPNYVVRVIFREDDQELPPRYFWLSWEGFDREVSSFFWYICF